MPNIVKRVGKRLNATTSDGKILTRQEYLLFKLGENITLAQQVDDDDHFLYQKHMPITSEDLITKYKGVVPPHLRGNDIMCTCGSDGVMLLEGPYTGKLICRAFMQFGKHQTSFKIVDGRLILDKQTESNYLADSAEDIIKNNIRNKADF